MATARELRKKARELQAERMRKIKEQEEKLVAFFSAIDKRDKLDNELAKAVRGLIDSGMKVGDISDAGGVDLASVRRWKKIADDMDNDEHNDTRNNNY